MSAYSTAILAESALQSYWKLDEASGNFTDSKGGFTGTAVAALSYSQQGPVGGAVKTDGVTGCINCGNKYAMSGTSQFTVEFWVNRGSANITRMVAHCDETNGNGWHVGLDGSNHLFARRLAGAGDVSVTGATVLAANTWYHVAYTWTASDGKWRCYVNGVLDGTSATGDTTSMTSPTSLDLSFFASSLGSTPRFGLGTVKSMQHVAIYNAVLSASTLLAHYQAAAVPAARTALGSEVTVFASNGSPGTFGAHYGFADTKALSDGKTLLCVATKADQHATRNSVLVHKKSTDDGATWSAETTIVDERGTNSTGWRDPYICVLASGRIALTAGRPSTVAGVNTAKPPYLYSDDAGATWSAPVLLGSAQTGVYCGDDGTHDGFCYGSDIVELGNGNLLLFGYGLSAAGGSYFDLFCAKSTDGGATWTPLSKPAVGSTYGFNVVEPQAELMANGDIYVTFHTEDGLPTDFYRVKSTDSGATWGGAVPVAIGATFNRQGLTRFSDDSVVVSVGDWNGSTPRFGYYGSVDGDAFGFAAPIVVAANPVGGAGLGTPLWIMATALGGTGASQNVGFTYSAENGAQTAASVFWRQFSGTNGVGVYRRALAASVTTSATARRAAALPRGASTALTAARASAAARGLSTTLTGIATRRLVASRAAVVSTTLAASSSRAVQRTASTSVTASASLSVGSVIIRTLTAILTGSASLRRTTSITRAAQTTQSASVGRGFSIVLRAIATVAADVISHIVGYVPNEPIITVAHLSKSPLLSRVSRRVRLLARITAR